MTFNQSLEYLKSNCVSFFDCMSEQEFKMKYQKSYSVYLIKWKMNEVFSWGTMSPKSNRIRKSSIFNNVLYGKYDRRVDYLMLLKIYGLEKVFVFDFRTKEDSRICEETIKLSKNQRHCFSGIIGKDRDEISKNIYSLFKKTPWYEKFDESTKVLFDEFFNDVFMGKVKHPRRNIVFKHGDVLEPKFLRELNKDYLEPIVEKVLSVNFKYNL